MLSGIYYILQCTVVIFAIGDGSKKREKSLWWIPVSFDVAALSAVRKSQIQGTPFLGQRSHWGRRLIRLGKRAQQTIFTCCVDVSLRENFLFSWNRGLEAADGLQIQSEDSRRGPG